MEKISFNEFTIYHSQQGMLNKFIFLVPIKFSFFGHSNLLIHIEIIHLIYIFLFLFLQKFKNMKVLKFDNCKYLTEISDVSCLPNLEILSFKNCQNLVTIDDSVGSLSKLEFLNAYGCINLLSFPALTLASLKDLELSCCDRLQSFPEILCEIKDIPEINISLTSIKEFPPSFQKLTGLTDISIEWLLGEGMFGFPSFISEMPKLKRIHLERIDMLSIPNSSSTTLSNVEVLTLHYNNLSDECLPTIFLWCSNVKYLRLNSGSFKILPECLKECRHLRQLEVSFCKNLEEIRGIPPNLDILIAEYSKPLNSSSRSMLVNKVILLFLG
jgi:Leucine-rich repeat (LRR) protein